MIKFEGVTFVKANVVRMKKAEFIDSHVNVFWRDRDGENRRKMLSQVYDLCAGTGKKK